MQKLRKYGVFTLALAMSASALIPTAAASPKAGTALPAATSSATPQMVDMTTSWSQAQKLGQQVQSLGKQVAPQITDSCSYVPLPQDARQGYVDYLNTLRAFNNIGATKLSPNETIHREAQEGSIAMTTASGISHGLKPETQKGNSRFRPGPNGTWPCNTAGGVRSTLSGLLSWTTWQSATMAYHADNLAADSGVPSLGHRMYMFSPNLVYTAVGASRSSSARSSSVNQVVLSYAHGSRFADMSYETGSITQPDSKVKRPATMEWPAAGYFPYSLMSKDAEWSLSVLSSEAKLLEGAQVEITAPNGTVTRPTARTTGISESSGYQSVAFAAPALVAKPAANTVATYTVKITAKGKSWTYPVRLFSSLSGDALSSSADKTAPVFSMPATSKVAYGSKFNPLEGVTAFDDRDGDVTKSITVVNNLNTSRPGTQTVVYRVKDKAGNSTEFKRSVTVLSQQESKASVFIVGNAVSNKDAIVQVNGLKGDYQITIKWVTTKKQGNSTYWYSYWRGPYNVSANLQTRTTVSLKDVPSGAKLSVILKQGGKDILTSTEVTVK